MKSKLSSVDSNRAGQRPLKVLVIDIGGSHVKCVATDHLDVKSFESGRQMTPPKMIERVLQLTEGWQFDVVSVGYPGVVRRDRIVRDPFNLAEGWVGFDFEAAFNRPVKVINDAAMQALGAYDGGKMLFLGLGTGLGSTLIDDGIIEAMELGHLPYIDGRSYEDYLGDKGRRRVGNKRWRRKLKKAVNGFFMALLPDYVVLGGGNVSHLKRLPAECRIGNNADAFAGGFRLWQQGTTTANPIAADDAHPGKVAA